MPWLTPPVTLGGAVGLLLVALLRVFWMVYQGKLIPRSTHIDLAQDRDHWRTTAESLVPAVADLVDQNRQLIQGMSTVETIARGLQQEATRHRPQPDSQGAG